MHKWVILERFPLLETAISNSHRSAADDYACAPEDVHPCIYIFSGPISPSKYPYLCVLIIMYI